MHNFTQLWLEHGFDLFGKRVLFPLHNFTQPWLEHGLDTYLALKTTLKVSLYSYLNPSNSGQIMTINTGILFVFEVGPSVKFVSAIIDAIFNKKN